MPFIFFPRGKSGVGRVTRLFTTHLGLLYSLDATAYSLLATAYSLLATAYFLLATAYSLLPLF